MFGIFLAPLIRRRIPIMCSNWCMPLVTPSPDRRMEINSRSLGDQQDSPHAAGSASIGGHHMRMAHQLACYWAEAPPGGIVNVKSGNAVFGCAPISSRACQPRGPRLGLACLWALPSRHLAPCPSPQGPVGDSVPRPWGDLSQGTIFPSSPATEHCRCARGSQSPGCHPCR